MKSELFWNSRQVFPCGKRHWEEGCGLLLLGDDTGSVAIMLRPFIAQYSGVCISAGVPRLYVLQVTISILFSSVRKIRLGPDFREHKYRVNRGQSTRICDILHSRTHSYIRDKDLPASSETSVCPNKSTCKKSSMDWGFHPSGIWRCFNGLSDPDVSREPFFLIFKELCVL